MVLLARSLSTAPAVEHDQTDDGQQKDDDTDDHSSDQHLFLSGRLSYGSGVVGDALLSAVFPNHATGTDAVSILTQGVDWITVRLVYAGEFAGYWHFVDGSMSGGTGRADVAFWLGIGHGEVKFRTVCAHWLMN